MPGRRAEPKNVYLATFAYYARAEINRGLLDNLHSMRKNLSELSDSRVSRHGEMRETSTRQPTSLQRSKILSSLVLPLCSA